MLFRSAKALNARLPTEAEWVNAFKARVFDAEDVELVRGTLYREATVRSGFLGNVRSLADLLEEASKQETTYFSEDCLCSVRIKADGSGKASKFARDVFVSCFAAATNSSVEGALRLVRAAE